MSEQEISADVRSLIADHIDSVAQLELLLLVATTRVGHASAWTAAEVSRELRIEGVSAEAQMDTLCTRGLLSCTDTPPKEYRYAPRDPAVARAVDGLARAYADRRVSVISLIYSKPPKPPDALRDFADAFRIRKDHDHG